MPSELEKWTEKHSKLIELEREVRNGMISPSFGSLATPQIIERRVSRHAVHAHRCRA